MKVNIVEVGPRDGLQNEPKTLSVQERIELIQKLEVAGLKRIEIGAFVSPKWVPQMDHSLEVVQTVQKTKNTQTRFLALVPNAQGMEMALKSGLREVAIFGACSEGFSLKNINCSIKESLERFKEVAFLAKQNQVRLRGYLSTAFGCPFDGRVSELDVARQVEAFLKLGVDEISVSDTIGVATPLQVKIVLQTIKPVISMNQLALHFHDTRGQALANVLRAIDCGVFTFDSSVGGLGGCPYALGASGNLSTEDLVYMLHGMGIETGIDLDALYSLKEQIEKWLGRSLTSRAMKAGPSIAQPF